MIVCPICFVGPETDNDELTCECGRFQWGSGGHWWVFWALRYGPGHKVVLRNKTLYESWNGAEEFIVPDSRYVDSVESVVLEAIADEVLLS